ncbi:MAG: hypothetical protein AABY22_23070 [Nanoarchaeota archaeon]
MEFVSIPEMVGIDYVGYIIEKERLNRNTGQWIRTDEYKIIGSRAINFKDIRVAYGQTYRYRIKSVLKLTKKRKKNVVTNFDVLTDLKSFLQEKIKEDIANNLGLISNSNSLFNKGIDFKVSSGTEKQSIDILDRFSVVFDKDGILVIDKSLKKQAYIPLEKQKDIFNIKMLTEISSKVDLKEILNKIVENKQSEEIKDFEYVSSYYSSKPSKKWIYIDTIDTELISSPTVIKVVPNSVKKEIIIYWTKPITFKQNVKFINLYRRNDLGQEWQPIVLNILDNVNYFIDKDVDFGVKYIYALTTVDVHNIESFLSTQVQVELNKSFSFEKQEKQARWISGPGANKDDVFSVFRPFFTRDEQLIARRNVVLKINSGFDEGSKDFVIRLKSLDTHEEYDVKLTLKNVQEI